MKGLWTGIAVAAVVVGATSTALAKTNIEPRATTAASASSTTSSPIEPLPRAIVADNVVVTPSPEPTQPQPTPAPVAVPAAVAPAVPVAEPETTTRHKEVRAEVSSSPNYMSTIAVSALMGGLAGLLVGGALHYIDSGEAWRNVGYWAAGGVLVGAGVGVVQLVVQENRVSEATALKHLPSDPAPTYRLALMRLEF